MHVDLYWNIIYSIIWKPDYNSENVYILQKGWKERIVKYITMFHFFVNQCSVGFYHYLLGNFRINCFHNEEKWTE